MFEVTFISKGSNSDVVYEIEASTSEKAWDDAEIRFILDGYLYARYEVEPRIKQIGELK